MTASKRGLLSGITGSWKLFWNGRRKPKSKENKGIHRPNACSGKVADSDRHHSRRSEWTQSANSVGVPLARAIGVYSTVIRMTGGKTNKSPWQNDCPLDTDMSTAGTSIEARAGSGQSIVDLIRVLEETKAELVEDSKNMPSKECIQTLGLAISQYVRIACRQSQIPFAGWGVFAEKPIARGDIICLYPGTALVGKGFADNFAGSVEDASVLQLLQTSRSNNWTVGRPDGVLVDANPVGLHSHLFRAACRREGQHGHDATDTSWVSSPYSEDCLLPVHPLATGHLVNHPPAGTLPNAAFHKIDWPVENMSWMERWGVPVVPLFPLLRGDTLPGVMIIALRDIKKGEEVYSDYAFDKDIAPEWYTPVNYGSDAEVGISGKS